MTWIDATTQLRRLLNDNETDKLRWRKALFGTTDSINKRFKTLETRRTTDFVTAPGLILGVFVNNTKVTVTEDSVLSGEFELAVAPGNLDTIEATYYQQYFLDLDLENFLLSASEWLGTGGVNNVPDGLKSAARAYAAAEAYQNLSMKWADTFADTYKVAELDPNKSPIDPFAKLNAQFRKQATASRDEFYKRQGRALQPLFASVVGNVNDPTPQR